MAFGKVLPVLVKVRLFAALRNIAKRKEIEVDVPGESADILSLLHFLAEKLGEEFGKAVLDPESNNVRHYVKVIVNGRDIDSLDGPKTTIRAGDVVQLFPPIGGGSMVTI